VDSVMQHVRKVVRDDRVQMTIYGNLSADPSPVSPIDTPSFSNLERTVHEFFPDAVPVPNLLVARTDSARYYAITQNVYKFFPAIRDEADVARVHGSNERLSTEDYLKSIQFMATLIRREALE